MTDRDHDERLRQLAADIAARLRGVCAHLTEAEFSELAMDIARMKVRFEVLEDLPGGLRPLPFRPESRAEPGDRPPDDERE